MPYILHHTPKKTTHQTTQFAAVLVPFNRELIGLYSLILALKEPECVYTFHEQGVECIKTILKTKKVKEADQIHLFYLNDTNKITASNPISAVFFSSILFSKENIIDEEHVLYPITDIDNFSLEVLFEIYNIKEEKPSPPPLQRKTTLKILQEMNISPKVLKSEFKETTFTDVASKAQQPSASKIEEDIALLTISSPKDSSSSKKQLEKGEPDKSQMRLG